MGRYDKEPSYEERSLFDKDEFLLQKFLQNTNDLKESTRKQESITKLPLKPDLIARCYQLREKYRQKFDTKEVVDSQDFQRQLENKQEFAENQENLPQYISRVNFANLISWNPLYLDVFCIPKTPLHDKLKFDVRHFERQFKADIECGQTTGIQLSKNKYKDGLKDIYDTNVSLIAEHAASDKLRILLRDDLKKQEKQFAKFLREVTDSGAVIGSIQKEGNRCLFGVEDIDIMKKRYHMKERQTVNDFMPNIALRAKIIALKKIINDCETVYNLDLRWIEKDYPQYCYDEQSQLARSGIHLSRLPFEKHVTCKDIEKLK